MVEFDTSQEKRKQLTLLSPFMPFVEKMKKEQQGFLFSATSLLRLKSP